MALLSSRCPLPALAAWCRSLKHALGAGLSPVRVFRQQAKSGPRAVRGVAADVADRLEAGDSLEDALAPHRDSFPPLFLELAAVGEQSGRMEDVFAELARYYETAWRTRQEFIRQMIYPATQFVAATGVIALLIVVLGLLAGGRGEEAPDPIGLGLTGVSGAITFLAVMGGLGVAAMLAARYVVDSVKHRATLEAVLLRVPGWGAVVLPFALQRFCLALRVSGEAGMPAPRCVHYGFRATANAAFMSRESEAVGVVMKGKEIAPALARSGAPFPKTFLAAVEVAEVTGQLSEVMERLADTYREEGTRNLKQAARLTTFAIYGCVGLLVVIAIFRIASQYLAVLNGL